MVSATTKIVNPMGMHMRPANLFAAAMNKYTSSVTIVFNGKEVNGKSIMNLMAACIKVGSEIEVKCDGSDEKEALAEAIEFIDSGLGE